MNTIHLQTPLPDNQSNIILHQFSIMAEELKNFTKQVLSNITKMMQAHNTTQGHTGKLIENAISQALAKTQDTTVLPLTPVHTSSWNVNYASPTYDLNQTSSWPTAHHTISHTPHINTHPTYRCQTHKKYTNNSIDNRFIKPPLTSSSQWLNSWGIKQN